MNKRKRFFASLVTLLIVAGTSVGLAAAGTRARQAPDHTLKRTCWGEIRDTSGNVIADLGVVATYGFSFSSHEGDCATAAGSAGSDWLKNKGQMCHAFFAANGGTLVFYYKYSTGDWKDSGGATTPGSYNYPTACFGTTGFAFPDYYLVSLIYTPPGCTMAPSPGYGCDGGSYVDYYHQSSMGSTSTITKSSDKSVNAGININLLPVPISATGQFEVKKTSETELSFTKEDTSEIQWPGSGPVGDDGINHDLDQFRILINPILAAAGWTDPITGLNHAQWALGIKSGQGAEIQRVQVSYLRCALAGVGPRPANSPPGNPGYYDPKGTCSNPNLQMPGPPGSSFDSSASNGWLPGLTTADYKQILDQDLFWRSAIDPTPIPIPTDRFAPTATSITYDRAGGQYGTSCPKQLYTATSDSTKDTTSTTEKSWQAGLTVGDDKNPIWKMLTSVTLVNAGGSITVTDTTSKEFKQESKQSASGVVYCASSNWSGPKFIRVWYDTLFGTFLFAWDDGKNEVRMLRGRVKDTLGDLVPHIPLKLVVGSRTYTTFSHLDGSFTFWLPPGEKSAGAKTGMLIVGTPGVQRKVVYVGRRASTTAVIPTPAPSLSVALGAPASNPPTSIAIKNQSSFATAKNVTVTAIQATSADGTSLAYAGRLPAAVPGGAALKAGNTASFPLSFIGGLPLATLSVTVQADNVRPFATSLPLPRITPADPCAEFPKTLVSGAGNTAFSVDGGNSFPGIAYAVPANPAWNLIDGTGWVSFAEGGVSPSEKSSTVYRRSFNVSQYTLDHAVLSLSGQMLADDIGSVAFNGKQLATGATFRTKVPFSYSGSPESTNFNLSDTLDFTVNDTGGAVTGLDYAVSVTCKPSS